MAELDSEIIYRLGRIEGKLDGVAEALGTHVKQDAAKHAELDDRVDALERSKNWVIGAAAASVVIVQAGWALLMR